MMTMLIDPAAAPTDQRKQSIMKVAAEINVHLEYVPQRIEKSISWLAPLSCNMVSCKHSFSYLKINY